jgi:hypothetical protein
MHNRYRIDVLLVTSNSTIALQDQNNQMGSIAEIQGLEGFEYDM